MKKYKVRCPAISQHWFHVEAENEEAAWRKVADDIEAKNPNKINWHDASVWEVRLDD